MLKMLKALAVVCSLGLAPSAFAIPFAVEITSSPHAAGFGTWSLSGSTTSVTGAWTVGFGAAYTGGAELAAGQYTWNLLGAGVGAGSISWRLLLGGQQIHSGSDSGFLAFLVGDSTGVGANPRVTSVPEPGTLLLLGTGFLGMALSIRRKRRAS